MKKILVKGANGFIGQHLCKHLTQSLHIKNSYVKKILNLTPPVSVEEGIRIIVKDK